MIRPRAQFPVNEKVCVIIPAYAPLGVYGLFTSADGFEIATDTDPRWLSNSALDSGAKEVVWGFDLGTVKEFV